MERLFYRRNYAISLLGLITFLFLVCSPVSATLQFTATEDIQNWALSPGINSKTNDLILTVTTDTAPWILDVKDASENGKSVSYAGRLVEFNSSTASWVNSGSVVSTNMTITGETISASNIAGSEILLGPTAFTIETGQNPVTSQSIAVKLTQPITYNDAYLSNGDVYRIKLTFTLTQP